MGISYIPPLFSILQNGKMTDHLGRMITTHLIARLQSLSGTVTNLQLIQQHFVVLRDKLQKSGLFL